jgi:hypothetical protein
MLPVGVDVAAAGVPELRGVVNGNAEEAELAGSVVAALESTLHASLLESVDLMGVGSNVPMLDSAEDTAVLGFKSSFHL